MSESGPITVLLVEDDERIQTEVSQLLRESSYGVHVASSVAEAERALERPYDLVLLDLGLPDGDGLDLCRDLRRESDVPVVVLTARDAPAQKVRGLDLGADDYVTKPFHPSEFLARIRSVLRRARGPDLEGRRSHGELWTDPENRAAGRGDRRFRLTPREFQLLHFLLGNAQRSWTREQLIDRVWGADFEGDTRTVDLYVRRLRKQVESDATDPQYLRTVWGVGYRLSREP